MFIDVMSICQLYLFLSFSSLCLESFNILTIISTLENMSTEKRLWNEYNPKDYCWDFMVFTSHCKTREAKGEIKLFQNTTSSK